MTTAAPTAFDPDLIFLLGQANYALNAEMTARLADIGSSPRTYCVLSKAMTGEYTQIRLAELTALDKTTMVVTLDALERAGLAQRTPSSTDRRARVVSVTDAGERLVETSRKVVSELYDDVLSTLSAGEREALVGALIRLVEGRLASPLHYERPPRRPRGK
jgi:MarR family transcriptional regulator, transcriptional regulator for hemolysin